MKKIEEEEEDTLSLDRKKHHLGGDEISFENIYRFAEKVSFPRLFGTDGNERGRELIKDEFLVNGYDPIVHEFRYKNDRFTHWKYFASFVVILDLFCFLIHEFRYEVNMKFVLYPLSYFAIRYIFNVMRSLQHSRKEEDPEGTYGENIYAELKSMYSRSQLIIIAHHDTKSQLVHYRNRAPIIKSFYLTTSAFPFFVLIENIILFVLDLINISFFNHILEFITILSFIIVIFLLIIVFRAVSSGNDSPGSIDNGTSVSLILELSRYFKEENLGLTNLDLLFLCPDAEEIGMVGSDLFIQKYESKIIDKRKTFVIGLEMLGLKGKDLLVENSEGSFKSDEFLVDMVLKVCKKLKIKCKTYPKISPSDHVPFLFRGYRTTQIFPDAWGEDIDFMHSKNDSMEMVGKDELNQAFLLLKNIVLELEKCC